MKNKKSLFIIITLAFILIVSGGVASFVLGLKADREGIQKRVADVNNEYESFSTNTSIFEEKRDELYNTTLGNLFYETMKDEDAKVKEELKKYEDLVDILTKNTKTLDGLCDNVYYPDSKVNAKCANYKSIYEQVVNYFISDINVYNSNIDKFNEYQKSNSSDIVIEKYKTDKKYIDYNNDKNYDGKEE